MVASVKQNADAIKSMPIIRNYVVDGYKELVRPHCKADVGAYAEWAIFTPGTAVLTSAGRNRLDRIAGWLNDNKEKGTEIVIAAADADYSRRIVYQIQRNILLNSVHLRHYFESSFLTSQQIGIRRSEIDAKILKWTTALSALFGKLNLSQPGNLGSIL